MEAARLDCAIIYGPHMYNFLEITKQMEEKQAVIKVRNAKELQQTCEDIILDNDKQAQLAKAALDLVNEKSGVVEAFKTEIAPYIEKITKNQ